MSKTYFNNRDLVNAERTEKILEEDLPTFCREYIVGIANNTTSLTRLNYAYDIRTFFQYMCSRIPDSKTSTLRK